MKKYEAYWGYVICPKSQGLEAKMIAGQGLGLRAFEVQPMTSRVLILPLHKGKMRRGGTVKPFCGIPVLLDSDCKQRLSSQNTHGQMQSSNQPGESRCVLVV